MASYEFQLTSTRRLVSVHSPDSPPRLGGINQEWKEKVLARRARILEGGGDSPLIAPLRKCASEDFENRRRLRTPTGIARPRFERTTASEGFAKSPLALARHTRSSDGRLSGQVSAVQSKESLFSRDRLWLDHSKREWHRWSHDRVDNEVWEEFREVKPKLPPMALRKAKQKQTTKQHSDCFMTQQPAGPPSMQRRASISSFIDGPGSSETPSWVDSHKDSQYNAKHLRPVAELGIETLMIDLLVRNADPDGDFSWNCPDPRSLDQLPRKLAATGRWHTFNNLLCDLKFCYQKLKHFPSSLLLRDFALYEPAISNSDEAMQRFTQYRLFFHQHHVMLAKKPSAIFKLAVACKYPRIMSDAQTMVANCHEFIERWYKHLILKDGEYDAMQVLDYRTSRAHFSGPKRAKNKDLLAVRQLAKLVTVRAKVFAFQECGVGHCFTPPRAQMMSDLLSFLQQKIQSQRSLLLQEGMQSFTEPNMSYLTKDAHRRARRPSASDAAKEDTVGEDATKFLHLVQIWDESEREEYVGLEVFVPAHTYRQDKERAAFEQRIRDHVAEAARIPAHLVELDKFTCSPGNEQGGTPGIVIVKVSDYVRMLEVKVASLQLAPSLGKKFGLVGESSVSVTLQLRISQNAIRRPSTVHGPADSDVLMNSPLAMHRVHQERMKPVSTQPKPYRDSDSNQEIEFEDTFEFRAPYDGLELHITCHDIENGNATIIGEVGVSLHDIVSFCATDQDDRHQHIFSLSKHDSRKHRTASVHLEFHDKVLAGSNRRSARSSAEAILMQAVDPNSKLRQKLVVTGPCYDEKGGGWEDLSLYVSSDYGQMHQEREFLTRFVFPALRLVSLERRMHFHWHEHSRFGTRYVSENLAKRVHDLDRCRIRTTNTEGRVTDMPFVLALVGESPGRHLSAREMTTLERVRSKHGSLEWAAKWARSEMGLSAHQMELLHVTAMHTGPSEPIIALRNAAFLNQQTFVECVPARIRAVFGGGSKGQEAWGNMVEVKRSWSRMAATIHYAPTFKDFKMTYGENLDKVLSQEAAGKVELTGMDELGLKIFQSLWKKIRKRYSTARCLSQTDLYVMEQIKQTNARMALSSAVTIFPDQTQRAVIERLLELYARTDYDAPGIVFLVGPHGSGKSSLLACLVDTLLHPPSEQHRQQQQGHVAKERLDHVNALPAFQRQSVMQNTAKLVIRARRIMKWTRGDDPEDPKESASISRAVSTSSIKGPESLSRVVSASDSAAARTGSAPTSGAVSARTTVTTTGAGSADQGLPMPSPQMLSEATTTPASPLLSPYPPPNAIAAPSPSSLPPSLPPVASRVAARTVTANQEIPLAAWEGRGPARVIYFHKSPAHSTKDLIFFLASSLVGKSCNGDLRWSSVDSFIRQMPALYHPDQRVTLIVLDGLSAEEADSIRRLATRPNLPVRFVVSASAGDLDKSFQASAAAPRKAGARAMTISLPPLSHMEQLAVYSALKRRYGVTHTPEFTGRMTQTEGAGCPLFLSVVVCYHRMCTSLKIRPVPLDDLQTDPEDLLLTDMLPTLEGVLGAQSVCAFFQVVMEFPDGCSAREVMQVLLRLHIKQEHIQTLSDILRPLSDPRISLSAGSVIAFSRAFIRRALNRRYNMPQKEQDIIRQLQEIKDLERRQGGDEEAMKRIDEGEGQEGERERGRGRGERDRDRDREGKRGRGGEQPPAQQLETEARDALRPGTSASARPRTRASDRDLAPRPGNSHVPVVSCVTQTSLDSEAAFPGPSASERRASQVSRSASDPDSRASSPESRSSQEFHGPRGSCDPSRDPSRDPSPEPALQVDAGWDFGRAASETGAGPALPGVPLASIRGPLAGPGQELHVESSIARARADIEVRALAAELGLLK